jgi:hypothetical protein
MKDHFWTSSNLNQLEIYLNNCEATLCGSQAHRSASRSPIASYEHHLHHSGLYCSTAQCRSHRGAGPLLKLLPHPAPIRSQLPSAAPFLLPPLSFQCHPGFSSVQVIGEPPLPCFSFPSGFASGYATSPNCLPAQIATASAIGDSLSWPREVSSTPPAAPPPCSRCRWPRPAGRASASVQRPFSCGLAHRGRSRPWLGPAGHMVH